MSKIYSSQFNKGKYNMKIDNGFICMKTLNDIFIGMHLLGKSRRKSVKLVVICNYFGMGWQYLGYKL